MTDETGDTINNSGRGDWKSGGFDKYVSRQTGIISDLAKYIPGAEFDVLLDELLFSRVIRFKGLYQAPQGADPGKTYFDPVNKKLLMWVDSTGKWVEIVYTSTSTSTSTTSTTSSSTSTTSTSTS